MPPIDPPTPRTVQAIYDAYAEDANQYEQWGINVGSLGHECARALWYDMRWTSLRERVDGKLASIFATGNLWEERLVRDLERIGVMVFGQQERMRLVYGHVRGKIDGKAMGLPEAPQTEHLLEFKSSKESDYKAIVKDGVKKAKPTHYCQCQLGMHAMGLKRCAYIIVNKNTDERHLERLDYDVEYCLRMLARAENIIALYEPPARIQEDGTKYPCRFCKHKQICHNQAFPRRNCRTCLHATPGLHGDKGEWSCDRWVKPLSIDEQRAGCPTHLYLPAIVPGEQIDSDADAMTVTYRIRSTGQTWTDGVCTPLPTEPATTDEEQADGN